jgi:4-diphosphocytidyl-2-C-methyl-D-erythritol kinase
MLFFPNCKINLGLQILNKREDGFHNLETVFYPVNVKDALEIIPSPNTTTPIEFTATGLPIEGNSNSNICVKAYWLLKKEFPQLPNIKMHLLKAIPLGAGLGGGSADGAFTLQLLNKRFNLGLSNNQLMNFAAQLGSDCPFFIINKPCFATGRGEILEPISIDLSSYKMVLINPRIQINTGWAFSQITPTMPVKSIKSIIEQPITTWKEELKNDFENPIFKVHPEIKMIKEDLYAKGAVYASMSGSGSTLYGIFKTPISLTAFNYKNYFIKFIA